MININGMRVLVKKFFQICFFVLISKSSFSQISISSIGTSFSQNFDAMGSSGTATLPSGFKIGTDWSTGTTSTTLAAGTSGTGILTSSSGGGTYNFANGVTASSTDRALGFLNSSGFTSPRSIVLKIDNNTGITINSLNIAFDYEKYRSGSRVWTWTFFHGATVTPGTSASSGDQAYSADADNTVVSNPPTTISKSVSITGLSLVNGASYYLMWTLTGTGGSTNGQALGIDNFSVTAVNVPTVTTNSASSISTSGATFNGTVSANGGSTTANFQYGLTASYGSVVTATQSPLASNSSNASISQSVSSLSVNTQYFYRATATNSAGTTQGSGTSFYTLANPPSAPTVNNPTNSSLDVTVNVNSNPAATEFAIQETSTGNYVQANGTLSASAVWQTASTWGTKTVTGLSVNTNYTFQVKARNGAVSPVETAFGSTASLYTLANIPSAPTVNGRAVNSLNVTVNVNGNPASTQFAIHETTTNKYVQSDGTLNTTPVFQNAATWGTKTVTGLTQGTSYTFEVKARNGNNVETIFGSTSSNSTLTPGLWTGAVSTLWNVAGNWDDNNVPNGTTDVQIPAVPNQPELVNSTTVNKLTFTGGYLELKNQFFTANGTVTGTGYFVGSQLAGLFLYGSNNFIDFSQASDNTVTGTNGVEQLEVHGSTTLMNKLRVRSSIVLYPTGTLNIGNGSLVIQGSDIANTPTNLLSTPQSSLLFSNSTATNIPSSISHLFDLGMNNTTNIQLNSNITIHNSLNFSSGGRIVTFPYAIIMAPGATVGAANQGNGYVDGTMQKTIPIGIASVNFEVGCGQYYSPLSVDFGNVTGSGVLTVTNYAFEHPDISNSGIDPNADENGFWTVTNGGVTWTGGATVTLNWDPADPDAAAKPLYFIVGKNDGGVWTHPTVANRTTTSIQATGLTSFSDFVAGMAPCVVFPTAYNVTGGNGSYCPSSDPIPHVGLDGSETGVVYELFLNLGTTGNIVTGTGSSIDFGEQTTDGNYTVVATNSTTGCSTDMTGSVNINTIFCVGTTPPTVSTDASPSLINTTDATLGGNISDPGTGSITEEDSTGRKLQLIPRHSLVEPE